MKESRAAVLRQKEIPFNGQRIKNLQADIKGLENLTGDNFKMKIGDTVYTKFGDAKKAFEKVIRNFEKMEVTASIVR